MTVQCDELFAEGEICMRSLRGILYMRGGRLCRIPDPPLHTPPPPSPAGRPRLPCMYSCVPPPLFGPSCLNLSYAFVESSRSSFGAECVAIQEHFRFVLLVLGGLSSFGSLVPRPSSPSIYTTRNQFWRKIFLSSSKIDYE